MGFGRFASLSLQRLGSSHDVSVQLCSWLIAIALGSYFLQKGGAGVDINAQFDLGYCSAMGHSAATPGFAMAHSAPLG